MNNELWPSIISAGATVIAGVLVFFLSRGYYKHSRKIENDKLLKELFIEFNERYDKINNELDRISKLKNSEWKGLNGDQIRINEGILIDYFNICSEEYYWYNEKRISKAIWESWHKGMNDIYNRSIIVQNLWDKECENEGYKSYYITAKDAFFKKD